MAAFAVVTNVSDVQFDPNSNRIILDVNYIGFNDVSESRFPSTVQVQGMFQSADWRVRVKDAIVAQALAVNGEDIDWVMFSDFTKS